MKTAVALCLAFLAAPPVYAQQKHGGFWLSGGLGGSGLSCLSCDQPRNNRWSGAGGGGYLAAGGTVTRNLLLGGEITAGFRFDIAEPGANGVAPQATVTLLSAIVVFYPRERGFHILGGPAVGVASITGGGRLIEAPGFGLLLGAGYDLAIGRGFAITPAIRYGQMLSSGTLAPDPRENVPDKPQLFFMGVGITKL
jgi:hypothetical protein